MKQLQFAKHLITRLLLTMAFLLPAVAGISSPVLAAEENSSRAVYTITNAASGNQVLVYARSSDGTLSFDGAYSTGGTGTGAGLGSQGAVALSQDHQWLFTVNAGSNAVSSFAVKAHGLELADVANSGGLQPISITVEDHLLYVLNAGGSGNISGFTIGNDGSLEPLAGSTQPLSNGGIGAAPGPAEIAFGPGGDVLVVTEKATNLIDTYQVENGLASGPATHASSGATPFGFAFDRHNHIVVSEAFGGAPNASALSSYTVTEAAFELVSPSVATTQTAACWVVISNTGKYAYTTNAGSGSISSYAIAEDGALTLLEAQAGLTGASPIDMAISNNGRYLYALAAAGHTISVFQIKADGSLASLGNVSVPAGVVGLAAQ